MAIEVVLCDLGGVLIDYSFDLAAREWARAAGTDPTAVMDMLVADEAWRSFEVNRLAEREFVEHIRRQCALSLTDSEIIAGWNAIYVGVNDEVACILREVRAKGTRLVAVTNTNTTHQTVWHRRFAADLTVFSAVYSSCDIGCRKPDAHFFHHVLSAEQLQPREALFVDDMEENVQGAARIGIEALRFSNSASLREAFAQRGLIQQQRS